MSAARRAAGAATDCGEREPATDAADGGFAANRAADGAGDRTRTGDIQLGKQVERKAASGPKANNGSNLARNQATRKPAHADAGWSESAP